MEILDFLKGQLVRIQGELSTDECFKDTQRYVNLTSVFTNLNAYIQQLEGIKKAREEEEKRKKELGE